ncbi:hypothetical protein N9450_04565 [Gammaproteobacteria bacterium]|nr:hypothetical protein [Gammaproteobacteria bacterium]
MKLLKIFFIKLLFTSHILFSEVEVTTIDAWRIVNAGAHALIVNKFAEGDSMNGFYFEMSRPHCLCETPTFVMYSPEEEDFIRPEEDTEITAWLRTDLKKWHEITLNVFLALDERKQNVLRLRGNFPSLRDAKFIELDSIYGKDKWVIKDINHSMKQATKLCESFIPYIDEKATKTKGKKV